MEGARALPRPRAPPPLRRPSVRPAAVAAAAAPADGRRGRGAFAFAAGHRQVFLFLPPAPSPVPPSSPTRPWWMFSLPFVPLPARPPNSGARPPRDTAVLNLSRRCGVGGGDLPPLPQPTSSPSPAPSPYPSSSPPPPSSSDTTPLPPCQRHDEDVARGGWLPGAPARVDGRRRRGGGGLPPANGGRDGGGRVPFVPRCALRRAAAARGQEEGR